MTAGKGLEGSTPATREDIEAMTAGKGLEGSTPATREDIEAMTKNEMITFALEKYQLKLNPQSSKGDMVDAIVDVMTKP
jgi:hypothetical protein